MTQIKEQLNLVSGIKANDELVLKQIYEKNYKKVEIYILQNSGSMPQAKDIYQEAFIAVWKNIKEGKFKPQNETSLQGYLYKIAKNKWIDELRSSRIKKTQTIENTKELSLNKDDNLADEFQEKERKIILTEIAFQKMGTECKELLTQFYFQKKSMRTIATFFNLEEASVRNKKYRCIQQLKNLVVSPK